jgi:hypothetical protein
MLVEVGFGVQRTGLLWASVERARGVLNFTAYDTIAHAAAERGVRTLFILCYGNPLYTASSSDPPRSVEAITAFQVFAIAAAARYAHLDPMFELWNEPNLDKFWSPQSNVSEYLSVANTVGLALKVSQDAI